MFGLICGCLNNRSGGFLVVIFLWWMPELMFAWWSFNVVIWRYLWWLEVGDRRLLLLNGSFCGS